MKSKAFLSIFLFFIGLTTLTNAQSSGEEDVFTLYGVSLKPAPTDQPSEINRLDPDELLNANIPLGGSIKDASAVGIDVGGGTIYVGVHEYSITVATTSGRLTTVTLPTPTTEMVTLFARPSGFYYRDYSVTVSNARGLYEGTLDFNCDHDIREGIPEEDGTVVCRKALKVYPNNAENVSVTTISAMTVGQAVAIATITNPPEDSVLPTLGLEETGFSTIVRQDETKGSEERTSVGWLWSVAPITSFAIAISEAGASGKPKA